MHIYIVCIIKKYVSYFNLRSQVLLGNSLTTNGDFSSYLLVTTIEGPTPALGAWCIVGPDLSAGYRYVAFQRRATSGFSILEFAEVEVYV